MPGYFLRHKLPQRLFDEIPLRNQPMRNAKLRRIHLERSIKKYVYIYRTVMVHSSPVLIEFQRLAPSKTTLDLLAKLEQGCRSGNWYHGTVASTAFRQIADRAFPQLTDTIFPQVVADDAVKESVSVEAP